MAIYAIGDIQGCLPALLKLLEKCAFDQQHDQLWLVGDIVNRGPQSLETLRFVRNLGKSAITVLGNHDLYLLILACGGNRKPSSSDSIVKVLRAPDRDELIDWLRRRPLCHVEKLSVGGKKKKKHCMVHAGLLPQWSLKQAVSLAREVETELRGDNFTNFMQKLWGNDPKMWKESLSGLHRLRLVVNAMTRMRFCTPEGKMEFSSKGPPDSAPPGYMPWFSVEDRKSSNCTLVTGHWSALGLINSTQLLALDTGYLWGGKLSAVRLHDRRLFQVDAN